MSAPLRIALDHNFPRPLVEPLAPAIVEATLHPVARVDPRMTTLDDDALIRALWLRGYQMFVTCDGRMLDEPSVLGITLQTKMSVVAVGQGHDPVAASGLLLAFLPHLAKSYRADEAQVWRLRVGRREPEDIWARLQRLGGGAPGAGKALYESVRLTPKVLRTDPLGELGSR